MTSMARLPRPALARYITIKFLGATSSNPVRVSSISAFGLHGQHPLGPSPPSEFKDRVLELVHSLKVLAGSPEASSVWSLDRDLQLVEMAQDLARRLNTEPSAMDCLLLAPSTDELMRFKRLQGVSAQAMQARFAIIKVCVWCVRGRGCLAGCRKLGSVAVAVVVLGEGGGARHAKRRILR